MPLYIYIYNIEKGKREGGRGGQSNFFYLRGRCKVAGRLFGRIISFLWHFFCIFHIKLGLEWYPLCRSPSLASRAADTSGWRMICDIESRVAPPQYYYFCSMPPRNYYFSVPSRNNYFFWRHLHIIIFCATSVSLYFLCHLVIILCFVPPWYYHFLLPTRYYYYY